MLKRWFGRADAETASADADRALVGRIREARLTYLSEAKLADIMATCRALEAAGTPGVFLEAGCALGGSTVAIASAKRAERELRVYDVFGMIPAPTDADPPEVHERYRVITSGESKGIGSDTYYGYQPDLYTLVQRNLQAFGRAPDAHRITLIKGLLQDTLLLDGPVAFAHIDVDWFDPVSICLQRIFPRLSVGGVVVLDDYLAWGGCKEATDAYLATVAGQYTHDTSSGAMKVVRTGPPTHH